MDLERHLMILQFISLISKKLTLLGLKRNGFLYSRDNYSYQLRDYLTKFNMEHATCVTTWSTTRKELQKIASNEEEVFLYEY